MSDHTFDKLRTPSGLTIAYEAHGPETGEPVIFAHGGGQTRHAWKGAAKALGAKKQGRGWRAIAIDMRGHGDSGWAEDGDYDMPSFAQDLIAVADFVAPGGGKPHAVGASLGGMASLTAEGIERPGTFATITLVDIVPRMNEKGVERITGFMGAHIEEGFASLEEAAAAIAEYLPHRPKPDNFDGLKKNLRLGEDKRWRWHWDPAFMAPRADRSADDRKAWRDRLEQATAAITVPLHLVRGRMSELVSEEAVEHFRQTVPHATVSDVAGARHMVAGDKNDVFLDAVEAFLSTHRQSS